eukprot:1159411-Pelagomonas_calceolata.AAC.15
MLAGTPPAQPPLPQAGTSAATTATAAPSLTFQAVPTLTAHATAATGKPSVMVASPFSIHRFER